MNERKATLAQGTFAGSTADELAARGRGDRIAAGADQRVLFPRRGQMVLHTDRLVISGWDGTTDLILRPGEVTSVRNEYTDLYGRCVGGLLNSGKPLILGTSAQGEIYLMVNHRRFLETTRNRTWARLLKDWTAS
ncbi:MULTISPECIES: hypothetical protein [unclassified Nonomuraea]|uniref:hypothetical protein n=1 Tax=unclassified Nonomuraea TaxID=2593643 RepID=UPI0034108879